MHMSYIIYQRVAVWLIQVSQPQLEAAILLHTGDQLHVRELPPIKAEYPGDWDLMIVTGMNDR